MRGCVCISVVGGRWGERVTGDIWRYQLRKTTLSLGVTLIRTRGGAVDK